MNYGGQPNSRVDLTPLENYTNSNKIQKNPLLEEDQEDQDDFVFIERQQKQQNQQNQQRKKLPFEYPSSPIAEDVSPYDVLGVSKDNSIDEINAVYKRLVIMLHPDKQMTAEALKMGWSVEEKNQAFREVRKAYQTILKTRKESNFPDYNIDYFINEEFSQQNALDRMGMTQEEARGEFNADRFNDNFKKEQSYHEHQGFNDPFSRGYNEFSTGKNFNSSDKITMPVRSDIEVSKNPILSKPEMVNGKIVRYVPKDTASVGLAPTGGFMELGVTVIDDFSMTMDCKGGICGSDLMSVYGQNNENWEDSVARDEKLYKKYNDQTRPEKKMNNLKNYRDQNATPKFDPRIQKQIDEENAKNEKMKSVRNSYLKQQDDYYENYSKRTIANHANNTRQHPFQQQTPPQLQQQPTRTNNFSQTQRPPQFQEYSTLNYNPHQQQLMTHNDQQPQQYHQPYQYQQQTQQQYQQQRPPQQQYQQQLFNNTDINSNLINRQLDTRSDQTKSQNPLFQQFFG